MTENGNAIVMIMIAIALFAALGVAFSNTSRTSTSFISDEEAKAYANQIIAYGNEIKSAVKRLRLRGCSDTEISFENPVTAVNYNNPNAPANNSCHVFDGNGGGLQIQTPNIALSQPNFIGNLEITDHGKTCSDSSCSDLFVGIRLADVGATASEIAQADNICAKINERLGHNDTLKDSLFGDDTQGGSPVWGFSGTYNYTDTINVADINGLKNYCVRGVNTSIVTYHQILIAR